MVDYLIRTARPADLDDIYGVFRLVEGMHRQVHPEIFRVADSPAEIADIKDYFRACIRSADGLLLVAEDDGEIIGLVIAWVRQTPENPLLVNRAYLNVSDLVVKKDRRKQGIGRALMEKVHDWARERGLADIQLTVWDFNEGARAFYRTLGYEILHYHMRKEL